MGLLKIAKVPAPFIEPGATVLEAVSIMARERVGAIAIVDIKVDGKVQGIFTERDLMLRVVQKELNPRETKVRDVMTSPVSTASRNTSPSDALALMITRHLRHLPIIGNDGYIEGMLSIRDLLQDKMDDLTRELNSVDQYLLNDGPGG